MVTRPHSDRIPSITHGELVAIFSGWKRAAVEAGWVWAGDPEDAATAFITHARTVIFQRG